MSKPEERRGFELTVTDAAVACLVAIVACRVAYQSLAASATTPWIEDLLAPCTGRPGWVPHPEAVKALPQWQAFIDRKIEYFPCDAISGMPLLEVGAGWEQVRYFHLSLSAWYGLLGPSLEGFITFQAGLYGAASAFAYLVFRLGLWRPLALACTVGMVWSKWQLTAVALPIEYAKAPWMFAALWLCGLILARDARGQSLWAPALLAGLVAGFGFGFKTDVLAAVPLALVTTLVFVRRTTAGPSRRMVASACVIIGVVVGGGAMLNRTFFGANGSVLAVQFLGGMDGASEAMHGVSPLYDYGLVFDDSHITALLNSYGRRQFGTTAPFYFFSREMQVASTRLLADVWTLFPGDLVLRVVAATLRVLQLNDFGLATTLGGLFLLFWKNPRAGWFAAFVIAYFSAYVSLVFQRRHFFHLEIVSWWMAGFLAQSFLVLLRAAVARSPLVPDWRGMRRNALMAAGSLVLIGTSGVFMLAAARAVQNRSVLAVVERYSALTPDEKRATRVVGPGGTLFRVEGVSSQEGEPDWSTDRMEADYLVANFTCRETGAIAVTAKYRPPGASWDRTYSVPCTEPQGASTLMVPIYQYGERYRFDGLWLSTRDADTVGLIGTLPPSPWVRLWLPLSVPADWQSRAWYRVLKVPLETP